MKYDIIVIGGGIIGSAINYELSKYDLKVLQLEKRNQLALETTAGNSGLIHCGFDATPGKILAKANVEGKKIWINEIFKNLEFPYEKVGSLVLAFNKEEEKEIKALYNKGLENGLKPSELSIVNKKQIKKLEPKINNKVYAGLYCPGSYAVDPIKATIAFVGCATQNGNETKTSSEVTKIVKTRNGFNVEVNGSIKYKTKYIVNAAGHFADKISQMAGGEKYKINARRGQYLILATSESHKVNNVCFKVPSKFGKGVVVAPTLDGRIQVGPTAKENINKQETRVVERKLWKEVIGIGNSIIPSINYSKVEKVFGASRPIYYKTGDFLIKADEKIENFIHLAGIKSPGVAASPYIAKMGVNILKRLGCTLKKKNNFKPKFKVWY